MAARPGPRLPGIHFEAQGPPPDEVLPRMDIAAFVGFAAAGPVNVPVAVEDPTQFAALFGADLPLAWDPVRGETVYAYLAPAVRAFFRNGGVRCWVVRVADGPETNRFGIPGLAVVDANGVIRPAFLPARSPGSWSDELRAGAALEAQTVVIARAQLDQEMVDLVPGPVAITVGDLLRLTYRAAAVDALFAVAS